MPSLNNSLKGFFIDGKPVKKASLGGKVFFEKHDYNLDVSASESIIQIGDETTITARLTDYNEPVEGETVVFSCDDAIETIAMDSSGTYDFGNHFTIDFANLPINHGNIIIGNASGNTLYIYNTEDITGTLTVVMKNGIGVVFSENCVIDIKNGVLKGLRGSSYMTVDVSDVDLTQWIFNISSCVIPIEKYFYETAVTDSNGECSVGYVGKGTGDLNIKVECMNLQETYEVVDAKFYASNSRINSQLTTFDNHNVAFFNYSVQYGDKVYFKFNSKPTHCLIGLGTSTQSALVWEFKPNQVIYHRNYSTGGSYNNNWLDTYSEIMINPIYNGPRAKGNIYLDEVYHDYWQFILDSNAKLRVDKFPNDDYDIEIIVL